MAVVVRLPLGWAWCWLFVWTSWSPCFPGLLPPACVACSVMFRRKSFDACARADGGYYYSMVDPRCSVAGGRGGVRSQWCASMPGFVGCRRSLDRLLATAEGGQKAGDSGAGFVSSDQVSARRWMAWRRLPSRSLVAHRSAHAHGVSFRSWGDYRWRAGSATCHRPGWGD